MTDAASLFDEKSMEKAELLYEQMDELEDLILEESEDNSVAERGGSEAENTENIVSVNEYIVESSVSSAEEQYEYGGIINQESHMNEYNDMAKFFVNNEYANNAVYEEKSVYGERYESNSNFFDGSDVIFSGGNGVAGFSKDIYGRNVENNSENIINQMHEEKKVSVTVNNNISVTKECDIDEVIEKLSIKIAEAVEGAGEGMHI